MILIISTMIESTRETADTAASPTLATIMESNRPTAKRSSCSTNSGHMSFTRYLFVKRSSPSTFCSSLPFFFLITSPSVIHNYIITLILSCKRRNRAFLERHALFILIMRKILLSNPGNLISSDSNRLLHFFPLTLLLFSVYD